MSFFGGIVIFIIVWWMVLFTVLPWGVRREEAPEAGHEPGAPANPRLWLKLGVTTLIACVIWGVIYWVMAAGIIHLGTK
jgi:predicted secreted protein